MILRLALILQLFVLVFSKPSAGLNSTIAGDNLQVPKIMEEHEIVPDVIDVAPKEIIQVTYENGVVNLGNELTPTIVKDQPNVSYPVEEGAYYTLCMTDPDAPSREKPLKREVKHWLVVNIPGSDVEKGVVLAGYRGSGPPQGTGLHRYVFLVYKQPGKLTIDDEPRISSTSREGRLNFKIRDFAKKYNLGQPVAGNFYQAQYDDYVPILQAQTISG